MEYQRATRWARYVRRLAEAKPRPDLSPLDLVLGTHKQNLLQEEGSMGINLAEAGIEAAEAAGALKEDLSPEALREVPFVLPLMVCGLGERFRSRFCMFLQAPHTLIRILATNQFLPEETKRLLPEEYAALDGPEPSTTVNNESSQSPQHRSKRQKSLSRDLESSAAHQTRAKEVSEDVRLQAESALLVERLRIALRGDRAAQEIAQKAIREAAVDHEAVPLMLTAIVNLCSKPAEDDEAISVALIEGVTKVWNQKDMMMTGGSLDALLCQLSPNLIAAAAEASPAVLRLIVSYLQTKIQAVVNQDTPDPFRTERWSQSVVHFIRAVRCYSEVGDAKQSSKYTRDKVKNALQDILSTIVPAGGSATAVQRAERLRSRILEPLKPPPALASLFNANKKRMTSTRVKS